MLLLLLHLKWIAISFLGVVTAGGLMELAKRTVRAQRPARRSNSSARPVLVAQIFLRMEQ